MDFTSRMRSYNTEQKQKAKNLCNMDDRGKVTFMDFYHTTWRTQSEL